MIAVANVLAEVGGREPEPAAVAGGDATDCLEAREIAAIQTQTVDPVLELGPSYRNLLDDAGSGGDVDVSNSGQQQTIGVGAIAPLAGVVVGDDADIAQAVAGVND